MVYSSIFNSGDHFPFVSGLDVGADIFCMYSSKLLVYLTNFFLPFVCLFAEPNKRARP